MVHEAIASVLAQRNVDLELIVVDDGSTDGTSEMLAGVDGIIVEQTAHQGPAAARNRGIARAHAPLIAFLDSDDLWAPEKLRRQLGFMREFPACAISQTSEIWMRDGRRVNPGLRHLKRAGDIFMDSLRTCLVSPSAVILKTELFRSLGGFDEDLAAAEDYDLWLRILIDHEAGLLDEPMVTRRAGHRDQLSSSIPAIDRFRVLALMKLLANARLSQLRREAVVEALIEKCGILAKGAHRRGRSRESNLYQAIVTTASQGRAGSDGAWFEMRAAMRGILVGAVHEPPAAIPVREGTSDATR